jgi:hypothetical protein
VIFIPANGLADDHEEYFEFDFFEHAQSIVQNVIRDCGRVAMVHDCGVSAMYCYSLNWITGSFSSCGTMMKVVSGW